MIRYLLPIAALGLLAACGDDPAPSPDDDARTASGEILEGTISDEMLPLETLQSQPPLVESSPGATGGDAAEDASADMGEDAEDELGEGESGEPPVNGETAASAEE